MKLSFIFTTLLVAAAAAATTAPPSFGAPMPTPAPVPKPLPACSKTVDTAVGAAGAAIKMFLARAGSKVPHLDEAIHAGNTCFKREIGCGVGAADGALPRPGQLDCSGTIDKGLKYAVAALRAGFKVFLPTGYDRGVKEGLKCFRETLGCKKDEA
ncbi:hypothetical protein HC256_000914 [Beauveria bassiana]|nr:hypothetical protein HC256_000914 [Beauveria bassiana]